VTVLPAVSPASAVDRAPLAVPQASGSIAGEHEAPGGKA
jgi:hypothetical protein